MIDPRVKWRNDDVPNLKSATMAELRHWLGVDPRRWAAAAAEAWEDSGDDLPDGLIGWFAAAIEAGEMAYRQRGETTVT